MKSTPPPPPIPARSPSLRRTFQSLLRGLILLTLGFVLAMTAGLIYRAESRDWQQRQAEVTHNLGLRIRAFLEQTTNHLQAFALIGMDEATRHP